MDNITLRKKGPKHTWIKDWCSIILSWVNSLNKDKQCSDIFNCHTVLSELIIEVFEFDKKDLVKPLNVEVLLHQFVKEYFPEFVQGNDLSLENEEDILLAFSLLMYSTCINCQIEDIRKNLNNLDNSTQKILALFFEKMMDIGQQRFTKKHVIQAIKHCLGHGVSNERKSMSPSPKCSTSLKTLFDSPNLQDRIKGKAEIRRLAALLEESEVEKEELLKKTQELEECKKKLTTRLDGKCQEIQTLREQYDQVIASPVAKQKDCRDEYWKKRVDEVSEQLYVLKQDNSLLSEERDKYLSQIIKLKKDEKRFQLILDEREKLLEEDLQEKIGLKRENSQLCNEINELRFMIEQLQQKHTQNDSLNNSSSFLCGAETCQTVIDLQLGEKDKEIEDLKTLVTKVKNECNQKLIEMAVEISQVQGVNEKLQHNVEKLCIEADELRKQLSSSALSLVNAKTEIQTLNSRLNELNAQLKDATVTTEQLKVQIDVEQENCNRLNDVVTKLEFNLSEANTLNEIQSIEHKKLLSVKEEQALEINRVHCINEQFQDSIEMLRTEADELIEQLSSSDKSLVNSKEEIESLNLRCCELDAQLKESVASTETLKLHHEVDIENINRLNSVVTNLELRLSEVDGLNRTINIDYQKLQSTNKEQVLELNRFQSINEELQERVKILRTEADDLRTQLSSSDMSLVYSKEVIEALDIRSCELETRLKESIATTETLKLQHEVDIENINRLNGVVTNIELKLSEVEALNRTLNVDNQKLQSTNDEQVLELNRFLSVNEELQKKVTMLYIESGELNSQLTSSSESLVNSKEKIETLNTRCCELEARLKESIATTETLKLQHEVDIENINRLNGVVTNIELKFSEVEALNRTLNVDNQKLQSTNDEQVLELNRFLSVNEELQKKVTILYIESGELNSQLTSSSESLVNSKEKIETLNTRCCELEARLKESIAIMETLKLQHEVDIEHINRLNGVVTNIELKLSEVEALNRTLNVDNQKLQSTNDEQVLELNRFLSVNEELQKKVTMLYIESGELNSQLTSSSESLVNSKDKIETLNKRCCELEARLKESIAIMETLKLQHEVDIENINRLNGVVTNIESKLSEVEALNRTLNVDNQKLQSTNNEQVLELNRVLSVNEELQKRVTMLYIESGELRSQLTSSSESLVNSKEKIETLNTRCCELEVRLKESIATMETLKFQHGVDIENINGLNGVVTNIELKLSEVEALNRTLNVDNQKLQSTNDEQALEINRFHSVNAELQERVKMLRTEADELRKQLTSSDKSLVNSKEEIEALNTMCCELDAQLKESIASTETLKVQYEVVIENINRLNDVVTNLELNLSEQETLNKTIKADNLNLQTSQAEQAAEINRLQCVHTKLEKSVEQSRTNIKELEKQLISAEENFEKVNQDNKQLISECSELKARLTDLTTANEQLKVELGVVTNAQLELSKVKEKNEILSIENEKLHSLKEEQASEIKRVQSINEQLQDSVEILGTKADVLKKQLVLTDNCLINSKEEIEALNCRCCELDAQVKEAIASAETLKEQHGVDNENIIRLNVLVTTLELKLKEVEALNKTLTSENLNFQTSKADQECLYKKEEVLLKEQVESKLGLIHNLEDQLNKLNIKTISENHNLSQEIIELQTKLNVTVGRLENKERQIEMLKEELNQAMSENEEVHKSLSLKKSECYSIYNEVSLKDQEIVELKKSTEDYARKIEEYTKTCLKERLQLENNLRIEYEDKLKKLKAQMKVVCTNAMQQTEKKCDEKNLQLQEAVKAGNNHITELSCQLWETSDKLVVTKKENEELKKNISDLKHGFTLPRQVKPNLNKTRSYEHLDRRSPNEDRLQDELAVNNRRLSGRTVPPGMGIKLLPSGKVFPAEDEGEVFSSECLADLRAGRCRVTSNPNRLSTLQYRNSLCPPHLKSSYPAETQFIPDDLLREDDIKGGDYDGDKRRKDRFQTSYQKPGPPTPSKHGGRVLSQAQEAPTMNKNMQRDTHEPQKKPVTPSRIFSHLFSGKQRDENTPSSISQRRLSFFNKRTK